MKTLSAIFILIMLSGCATSQVRKSFLIGAGIGAAAGATGGAVFSPNGESRGLNALVFGLSGAAIGGLIGLWSGSSNVPESDNQKTLREREMDEAISKQIDLNAPSSESLPSFVKERLSKLVIEEMELPDRVGEDGVLHEPHRAYRVKRAPELFAKQRKQSASQIAKPEAKK